jgi:uncharacterized lipoprotein YajG
MRIPFSILLLGISILSGCALAPKVVHLESITPVSNARFTKSTCIVVGEFNDGRKDQEVIGHTYNFGFKTSDVKAFGNVSSWIREAYSREMKNAGAKECGEKDQKLELTGTVVEVAQEESWNINTVMKVELRLKGAQTTFSKTFEAKSSQISHAASESEFTDSLFKALQTLMKESVQALISKAETE